MVSLKRVQSRAAIIRASRRCGQMGRGACLDSRFASVNTAAVEIFVHAEAVRSHRAIAAEPHRDRNGACGRCRIAQFRLLAMRTGQSVYYWQVDAGITSLRERDVRVPGSKRVTEALRYILQSMQFGVYLFTNYDEHLRAPNIGLLRQIARTPIEQWSQSGVRRRTRGRFRTDSIVLTDRIKHTPEIASKPRLRDGRWVT